MHSTKTIYISKKQLNAIINKEINPITKKPIDIQRTIIAEKAGYININIKCSD